MAAGYGGAVALGLAKGKLRKRKKKKKKRGAVGGVLDTIQERKKKIKEAAGN